MSPIPEVTAPANSLTNLPAPADHPESDVVVFDGNCQFCWRQVRRLQRLDRGGRLAFLSLHDPSVRDRYPNLTHEQLMEQMYVIDREGNQHGGASAIRYLTRRLPRLWPIAPLLHLPFTFPVWKWLYRQVAIRRYRFNQPDCDNGACSVHLR